MIRRRQVALAALVVVAALLGGLLVVLGGQSSTTAPVPSPSVATEPVESPTVATPSAPADTVRVDDRYRARYRGTYVGWDALLDAGTKLPEVSSGCRSDWQQTTRRDDGLNWDKAGYLCLDRLTDNGFKPQGVAGSGAAKNYLIGGEPADRRNLVLVSSYSDTEEEDLRFPHQPGKTEATRLTVLDLDRGRYNTVELVKPVGANSFAALDSHGSGFAWAGQYLYSSSRGALWMYNADDLMEIDGRYVLPAVGHWNVRGLGGLSSIGIDRSNKSATLTGINYNQNGTAWAQSFELDADGALRQDSAEAEHELHLINVFGPGPSSIQSSSSSVIPGTNFQGIGTLGAYRFVNSSSLLLDGRRHGDNVVIVKKNQPIARFAMPKENVESVYVNYRRREYVTVTEHGRQFLFWFPLDHLIDRAER